MADLVPVDVAKLHLRAEDADDAEVQLKLTAAERAAALFLNRRIFADEQEMADEIALVPAAMIDAGTAYRAAITAAEAITDSVARAASVEYAQHVYETAQRAAYETRHGVVVDELITAGILLTAGHLWENRQDVVVGASVAELPRGAQTMLWPYRIGLGV